MKGIHRMTRAAIALAPLVLAACASAPPDQFYHLGAPGITPAITPAITRATPLRQSPVVLIAPVSVPDLVDRPQIVTLGPGSRVQVSDQQRWAEPLKLAVGRLLADRVSGRLGLAQVWSYPAEPGSEPQFRINVALQRFDSEAGVAASSTLLWTVRRMRDGQARSGRSETRGVPADAGMDALVEAHGLALARAGDEIAAALAELSASAP
jgi:uncharacterized lipoprotein YmbA